MSTTKENSARWGKDSIKNLLPVSFRASSTGLSIVSGLGSDSASGSDSGSVVDSSLSVNAFDSTNRDVSAFCLTQNFFLSVITVK